MKLKLNNYVSNPIHMCSFCFKHFVLLSSSTLFFFFLKIERIQILYNYMY